MPDLLTALANGRYVLRRLLGEGSNKRVHLAHDTRLERDVPGDDLSFFARGVAGAWPSHAARCGNRRT